MPTIHDVARAAGVSSATVSHVINNSRFVAPATMERVHAAISSLGYRRDGIARSLRRSKTGTIGLLVTDISNPFFPDVVRGVQDLIHSSGHDNNVILCNTDENDQKERLYLDVLLEKRVDGIVMTPAGGNQDILRELATRGFPLVFVDRWLPDVAADAVVVDNYDASYRIVTHLIGLGHRHIAIMIARLAASAIKERLEGYRAALAAADLPFYPQYVVESASTIEAGWAAGLHLIDTEPRPTAVFGTNNHVTIGMMQALAERDLRCPEDMAVVGFDDFPWASAFHPRLTTVAQPGYELGRTAAELLLQRMSGTHPGAPIKKILHAELKIRESCGNALVRASAS